MTHDLERDLRDAFRRHEHDVLGHGPTPSPGMVRRIRRRQTGTVLMAVVAAAAIAIAGNSGLDAIRSSGEQTPAAPGGAETRPAETGPAWLSHFLPPEGAEPSSPAHGKLLLKEGGTSPWWFLQVYADGRVIWLNETYVYGSPGLANAVWQERRLTPEGVELLRSGVVRLGAQFHGLSSSELPASVWEDPEAKPYVPSRYVVCASRGTFPLLPQSARDLLHSYANEQAIRYAARMQFLPFGGPGFACPAVTIEEARALDKIFVEAGFERGNTPAVLIYSGEIVVIPLLPDGTLGECGCS